MSTSTSQQNPPQPVLRKDYRPPAFLVDQVELRFDLREVGTTVHSRLTLRRNPAVQGRPALVLDGEELQLLEVALDGRPLASGAWRRDGEALVVPDLPERCVLETKVRIAPETNGALSGLYQSGGLFCTQCEAMGFRRITFFPDRPDVMSSYAVTIEADPARWPVLLSNGNRVGEGTLEDGRRWVRWEDPWKKPSYLFALVAGDLRCHAGTFTTRSGRQVRLEVWVEPQNADKCEHALRSLQESMRWDEEAFGLEYDLDVYMIVAVNDFNMGAMENKGLNVFNSKFVLARPDTATDDDYERIQGVIGHEYFHNWTGNRVTCRDWFQLTLKEGLTVFRDQQFTADMTSAAVKRIADVRALRVRQFAEDAGPMSHPVRPESYISMDNFYTATVYEKGAEVVRMYHTLLGAAGFRRGMDLYFQRHDGHAVTCDDFRAAMADANGRDLSQFERWYSTPGTPTLEAVGAWDQAARTWSLTLRQVLTNKDAAPLHVPVRVGLLGADGRDLPLQLAGEARPTAGGDGGSGLGRVLELTQREQTFRFVGLPERPVPSLLRGFSAPVKLKLERARAELAFLAAHDSDPFNRWDAGQELAMQLLLELAGEAQAGRPLRLDPVLVEVARRVLGDERLDPSLQALALGLPAEQQLAQEVTVVDPDAIHAARQFVRRELARALRPELSAALARTAPQGPYPSDKGSIARRRLRLACLGLLASLEEPDTVATLERQVADADNMTDAEGALMLLAAIPCPQRDAALAAFHARWREDPLVLDKWFTVQAVSPARDTVERVRGLARHPDFTTRNPNRCRALVGAFGLSNQVRFHTPDGAGYAFLADTVLAVDAINPQLASRLVSAFNPWKRLEPGRRALMEAALRRIAGQKALSKDVFEIVDRALTR